MELDRERQGTEDLRREIQSYINQVRQVEAILARKVDFTVLSFNAPFNFNLMIKLLG